MCTLLAKIQVEAGKEASFEEVMAYMYRETQKEDGVLRYEYWRGTQPGFYYCLLAFTDTVTFWRHQASDHHEGQMANFQACISELELEVVDPVAAASPLPPTREQDVPEGEAEEVRMQAEQFPISTPAWWRKHL